MLQILIFSLLLLQEDSSDWFKSHAISIDDKEMKMRLAKFIVGWTDPFAAWIKYHSACWSKHITNLNIGRNITCQNVEELEVNQLTFS